MVQQTIECYVCLVPEDVERCGGIDEVCAIRWLAGVLLHLQVTHLQGVVEHVDPAHVVVPVGIQAIGIFNHITVPPALIDNSSICIRGHAAEWLEIIRVVDWQQAFAKVITSYSITTRIQKVTDAPAHNQSTGHLPFRLKHCAVVSR
jgi:hypothetical protein